MAMAKVIAKPRLIAISGVNPDLFKANPPFNPSAISRYKDKNREIGCGISRLDLTSPAKMPKIKNRIEGSSKLFINFSFEGILGKFIYKVKSKLQHLYIDKNL